MKCNCQSLPHSHPRYVHQQWIGLSNKGRFDGSVSYWTEWVSGLLYPQKSQAKVSCFTVLLSPFSEKAFGLTFHSASFPWWVASDKLLVSILGTQGLEPYPPFYTSLCFLSHSPHFLAFSCSCGELWGKLGSSRKGGQSPGPWLARVLSVELLLVSSTSFAVSLAHKRSLPLVAPTVNYCLPGQELYCF